MNIDWMVVCMLIAFVAGLVIGVSLARPGFAR